MVKAKEAKEPMRGKTRGWKRKGFAIAFLMLLLYISAITAASAVNAVVVSEVKGLGDYVPQSHSFTHDDTLRVYAEMQDVNHVGFVSVDFYFIIEDPKGHVVATDSMSVERENYRALNDYVEYTKEIQDWWLNGKYELGIYAYDRVDDTKTREAVQKIRGDRDSPEKLIEDEGFELGDVVTKSLTDSRKEKTSIVFFVHPEEIIEIEEIPPEIIMPTPRPGEVKRAVFTVTDISIDKFTVKPDEPVSISVTVKNTGIEGTGKVTVDINGEKEAEELVTLGYMESKTPIFHVTKDLPGTYKVTVSGSDIVKLFFVEEGSYEEGDGEGAENSTLSASKVSESGASPGSGLPIHVFVGIAFIVIFAIVIIIFRFRR